MLPYGNARTNGTQVACQHGPTECQINMVEACAIKHLPAPEDYMSFIFCAEGAPENPKAVIGTCAKEGVKADIEKCYGEGHGEEGTSLIADAAKATAPLNHQYTPWIAIDDVHSQAAEQNLEKAICQAYKGSKSPPACAKYAAQRCYRENFPAFEEKEVVYT
eukprot:TRINITY_DN19549_c0_g1_i2.p1 TRINITY_DN19549_c0_g1~~TRINITY_DN19549_c0_g1_i2.p1  ORF type:complete len:162 (-),score=33.73 TRINITY_DN19549_c0_g1_i2:209-694(-)